MKSTTTVSFNYSKFLAQVDANKVKTAAIDPNGGVTGTLRNGDDYTTQIPVVLNDAQLAPTLKSHDVAVTGVGPRLEPRGRPAGVPAAPGLYRALRMAEPEHPPANGGRAHGHRWVQGEGVRRAAPVDRAFPTSPATRVRSKR